jgi:hypothetical protein
MTAWKYGPLQGWHKAKRWETQLEFELILDYLERGVRDDYYYRFN